MGRLVDDLLVLTQAERSDFLRIEQIDFRHSSARSGMG